MTALKTLNLASNAFAALADVQFTSDTLEELDLSDRDFTELPEGALAGWALPALRKLSFCNGEIKTIAPDAFRDVPDTLECLDLRGNAIVSLPEKTFEGLGESLAALSLSGNKIDRLEESLFSELTGLRHLDLSNNRLSSLPDLTGLTALDTTADEDAWGTTFCGNDLPGVELENRLPSQLKEDLEWLQGQIDGQQHADGSIESSTDGAVETSNIPTGPIPASAFKASANSIDRDEVDIANAFDGDDDTLWHTKISDPDRYPYLVEIQFNERHTISEVQYVPRQDGVDNGTILKMAVYAGTDAGSAQKMGEYTFVNDKSTKTMDFDAVAADYVKFEISEGVDGWASAAEFRLYEPGPQPDMYAVTVAEVVGGSANISVDVAESAAGETVAVFVAGIEADKAFRSIVVTNEAGDLVPTTEVAAEEAYSFVMPQSPVTITVAIAAPASESSREELLKLFELCETAQTQSFTPSTWAAVLAAWEEAKAVYNDPHATEDEVTNACTKLNSALNALQHPAKTEALQQTIEEAKDILDGIDSYLHTGKVEFLAALENAEEVLANKDADQHSVDLAEETLEKAMAVLQLKGDITKLGDLLADGKTWQEADYTPKTWEAFQSAMDAAQAVYDKEEVSQEEADNACEHLRDAIDALTPRADTAKLQEAIGKAEEIEKKIGLYVTAGKAEFLAALDAARAVVADKDATQNDVDDAETALLSAGDALRLAGDKTALGSLLAACKTFQEAMYTPGSWANFPSAWEAAKELYAKPEVTVEDVKAVFDPLYEAAEALVFRADTSELRSVVARAEEIEAEIALYSDTGKTGFLEKLDAARKTIDHSGAPQSEVTNATDALRTAMTALRPKGDDTALRGMAGGAYHFDSSLYTDDSWADLQKELAIVQKVIEAPAPTEKDVQDALKRLSQAIARLEPVERGSHKALEPLISTAKNLYEFDYSAPSWSMFRAALTLAQACQENTEKEVVESAYNALASTMSNLVCTADTSGLRMAIEQAEQYVPDLKAQYIPEGQEPFLAALGNAKKLLENRDVFQLDADKATENLNDAILSLRLKPNKEMLQNILKEGERLDLGAYTDASAAEYRAVLKLARSTYEDPNATVEVVLAACSNVQNARVQLTRDPGLKPNPPKPVDPAPKKHGSSHSSPSNYYGKDGLSVVAAARGLLAPATLCSDTNSDFTLKKGNAYCFKITVANGLTPSFTVGNGNVLKTQFVAQVGNDYYYRIYAIGKEEERTGVYTTLPNEAPRRHCVVTVG